MSDPDETIITNKAKNRKLANEAEKAKAEPRVKPKRPERKEPETIVPAPQKISLAKRLNELEASLKRLKVLSLLMFLFALGLGGGLLALSEQRLEDEKKAAAPEVKGATLSEAVPLLKPQDAPGEMKKLLREIRSELEQQKARNRLTKLADESISTGSRYAFRELERFIEDPDNVGMKDACNTEIIRVESHYITSRRYRSYSVPTEKLFPGKKISQLTLDDLSELLSTEQNHWGFRAWAARQLGDLHGDVGVPDALVRAMKAESNLCVVQEALRSFEKITGYQPPGVFDTNVAVSWWAENKERFAKAGGVPRQR